MSYLGIDLHRKQMTVSLRNESGDVLLRRQVSTRLSKMEEFRQQMHQVLAADEKYVAVVEVCGFHDWLVQWLKQDERCRDVLVVQPLGRSATKTDRRDAHGLSELLWVNRERLQRGERVHGVRTVQVPSEEQQADRCLTMTRERLVRRRTQTLNQIHKILRRRNLEWEQPTKTFQTVKVRQWLKTVELAPPDRSALNQLLRQWELWDEQLLAADGWIRERFLANREARLLATMPGVSMFIGLAIACRIAPIERFPRGRSFANFLGLTPGCNSSGDTERVGSITKIGSRMAKQWHCHAYGCGKGGNLVSLCDMMKPGPNGGGRPRGERFKEIAADLQAMATGTAEVPPVAAAPASSPATPPPAAAAPRNVPLRESDNERARGLVTLDAKFQVDIAEMSPRASAYFRRRAFLTPEVCRQWTMGYLPRDTGGEDRSGGTMRGRVVYAYRLRPDQRRSVATRGDRSPIQSTRRNWLRAAVVGTVTSFCGSAGAE